jgi:hypothetical protein
VFHVLLGFVPIIGSALVFSVVAWGLYDAGGGNLISYCRRGYSLDFVPELVFAANTVIGVGRNSLYYAENSRVGGPKIRIIEYDAIGEIESVAYTVKNSGQSFGDIEKLLSWIALAVLALGSEIMLRMKMLMSCRS